MKIGSAGGVAAEPVTLPAAIEIMTTKIGETEKKARQRRGFEARRRIVIVTVSLRARPEDPSAGSQMAGCELYVGRLAKAECDRSAGPIG